MPKREVERETQKRAGKKTDGTMNKELEINKKRDGEKQKERSMCMCMHT